MLGQCGCRLCGGLQPASHRVFQFFVVRTSSPLVLTVTVWHRARIYFTLITVTVPLISFET
jgi:hypothetical protein